MKIGDYVRTKNYGIAKITRIDPIELVAYTDNKDVVFGVDEKKCVEITGVNTPMKIVGKFYEPQDNAYILDYNSNIIDLIEVGDIVKYNLMMNGYIKKQIFCKMIKDIKDLMYFQYQIQHKKANLISILTKEQFESMEYKVGDDNEKL